MDCPICSAPVALTETRCPKCGANLAEYSQVYYLPDRLFNNALSRMRHQHYGEAAELLCRADGLRPGDREILLVWAECCARSGQHAAAVHVLEKALDYFSEDDAVIELFQSENELAGEVSTW